jgi:hypothetical protein
VLPAAVLFLVGVGSPFPLRARYGLNGVAGVLLVISVVQLLGLPAGHPEPGAGRHRAVRKPGSVAAS